MCEDDSNIATIALLALEQLGQHKVITASDGEQALKLGTSENFDVILLDEMMPKMSGIAVCQAFITSGLDVAPVIFMSANPQHKRVQEFSPLAIGYIPKPFDPMTLNNQILSLLTEAHKKAV